MSRKSLIRGINDKVRILYFDTTIKNAVKVYAKLDTAIEIAIFSGDREL